MVGYVQFLNCDKNWNITKWYTRGTESHFEICQLTKQWFETSFRKIQYIRTVSQRKDCYIFAKTNNELAKFVSTSSSLNVINWKLYDQSLEKLARQSLEIGSTFARGKLGQLVGTQDEHRNVGISGWRGKPRGLRTPRYQIYETPRQISQLWSTSCASDKGWILRNSRVSIATPAITLTQFDERNHFRRLTSSWVARLGMKKCILSCLLSASWTKQDLERRERERESRIKKSNKLEQKWSLSVFLS